MADQLVIEGLEIDCIVGVLPHEREHTQLLRVDLAVTRGLALAGRSGRITDTVDYARIADEVAALLRFRRYRLLENAAEELAAMILGLHEGSESVDLRLTKPEAISGARGAGVKIERRPNDYPRRRETPDWGEVEVLLETREAGLYLLHIAAGHEIPAHHHAVMRELEWLVAGELLIEGETLVAMTPRQWDHGQVHAYRNASSLKATLFCCDCPPFIRDDEIVRGSSR